MNNCHIGLSVDNEIVITRKHLTGETVLVIDEDGDFMVSYCAYAHPSLGWRKFVTLLEGGLPKVFELFNKEE